MWKHVVKEPGIRFKERGQRPVNYIRSMENLVVRAKSDNLLLDHAVLDFVKVLFDSFLVLVVILYMYEQRKLWVHCVNKSFDLILFFFVPLEFHFDQEDCQHLVVYRVLA